MRKYLAALALLLAPPAFAQIPEAVAVTPEMLAQLDSLPVERMCSTRGAFQYDFGSTDLPPSLFTIPGMDKYGLPASAAPFKEGAFSGTAWSNRFFMANYDLHITDKTRAPEVIERLAAHFRKRGWIERKGDDEPEGADGPMIDFPPSRGDIVYYSEAGARDPDKRTGVRAALSHMGGGWISFECTSMPMMVVQFGEAFGNLPEGTPRPIEPNIPRAEVLNPALCQTPEGIAEVDTVFGGKPDAMTRYLLGRSRYRERLLTWKTDRLKKSGKVTGNRILEVIGSGLSQGMGGDSNALLGPLGQAFEKGIAYGEAKEAGDNAGACRTAVALLRSLAANEATVNRQWAAMETAIDAEARRVGVSWD